MQTLVVFLVKRPILVLVQVAFGLLAFAVAISGRQRRDKLASGEGRPRLFWGSVPILNNKYWAAAMRRAGYVSQTFTTDFYNSINARKDWDLLLSEEYRQYPSLLRPYMGFLRVLREYDIVFISSEGVFIGGTWLGQFQAHLFRAAGIKVVVIPYGADSYVYRSIRSTSLLYGLLSSYPQMARKQEAVARRVAYWCRHADAVIPGFMGPDGFGRWDVLIPTQLFIDHEEWHASRKKRGLDDEVVICHSPNHRGFKGTEFVVEAVSRLRAEGVKVRLKLLEHMQNAEVRRVLQEEADILVEQLVYTGHGLNGLEGLATGLPVVANLEDEQYTLPMRRWSYLGECPVVSASPESLVSVLRELIARPDLRATLGRAGRQYVEKYHGLDSAAYLFEAVIDYVYGRRESLINLYHPLLGEYPRRLPTVEHPLANNRIVG